jgi:hypothetical protein
MQSLLPWRTHIPYTFCHPLSDCISCNPPHSYSIHIRIHGGHHQCRLPSPIDRTPSMPCRTMPCRTQCCIPPLPSRCPSGWTRPKPAGVMVEACSTYPSASSGPGESQMGPGCQPGKHRNHRHRCLLPPLPSHDRSDRARLWAPARDTITELECWHCTVPSLREFDRFYSIQHLD